MTRSEPLQSIFDSLDQETQKAIDTLEERGLKWMAHFGYDNAIEMLHEMDIAFEQGWLYQWMKIIADLCSSSVIGFIHGPVSGIRKIW